MDLRDYLWRNVKQAGARPDVAAAPVCFHNGRMLKVAEFPLRGRSAATAARRTRLLATLSGLPARRSARFAKAVAGVVHWAASAGVPGTLRFTVDEIDGRQCVAAEVELESTGKLAKASGGDQPAAKTGHCGASQALYEQLDGMRVLVDQFEIRSDGTGCIVYLGQILSRAAAPLAEGDVANWHELLQAGTPTKALAQFQRQVRRLATGLSTQPSAGHPPSPPQLITTGSATFELLSRVVSDTTNTVAVIGHDGRVEWVNQAFETLTGYTADEAVKLPFDEFLFGIDSDPVWVARLRRMMTEGKAVSGERMHRRRDGKQYWCTFNISPLHEPGGKVVGWVDIGWDTTAARKAREELERATRHAEAANYAKTEFLAHMSHEIRTPMNTILGMTELALGTPLTEQQSEYLGAVKDSAQSLLRILNDILDLSKIEAQRLELEEIDFNLTDLLRETMRPLLLQADKKGLELLWHLSPDVPLDVRGDPTRLRQVLLNLVSNAIKFTDRGGVSVSVEKQWSGAGEVGIQISVRDTGIGVPPDRLSKIFEAFTQADSSTTRKFGGTGLGLTITAELLRLMNGRIWVDSTVGEGSTFYCNVRLRESKPAKGARPPRAVDVGTGGTGRSLKILVADDHSPNRQLVAEILRAKGYTFQEATNGHEVLKLLSQEKFDVVLMDVQMPDMDGLNATAAIRAAERETKTHQPIIAVTAYAMKGDREKCLAAGMDAYLTKPIQAKELIRLVETLAATTPKAEVTPLAAGYQPPELPSRADRTRGFDFGQALGRLAGDAGLLKRQMSFFLDEAPRLVEQLQSAIASADADKLKLFAHRLRGFVSTYDHCEAVQVAQQLERCASNHQFTDARGLANSLARHVDELGVAIRNYMR